MRKDGLLLPMGVVGAETAPPGRHDAALAAPSVGRVGDPAEAHERAVSSMGHFGNEERREKRKTVRNGIRMTMSRNQMAQVGNL
jgi:hypothetical protein